MQGSPSLVNGASLRCWWFSTFVGSNPTPCMPYRHTYKYPIGKVTKKILKLLIKEPKTSAEIQNEFSADKKAYVRFKLSELYKHGHLVRSPFKTFYGFIYSLPQHKDKIIEKLKEIVPPYVRQSIEILAQRKIFTLNELVEKTHGNFETLEYYLDNIFSKQLRWINYSYHKSFKIYWNAKFNKEELYPVFLRELSQTYSRIKSDSLKFEKEVKELLDTYFLNLPFRVVKSETGTPSKKYFDVAYKIYLFGENSQPIHLKIEIKSFVPGLIQVTQFYRKVREFCHASIIPVMIAPAFPSVVYQTFGDVLYLVPFEKLKEFIKGKFIGSVGNIS
jgi:hypothetical protein